MGRIVRIDKSDKFAAANEKVMDMALARMARDGKQMAMIKVPLKSGDLMESAETERIAPLKHKIWFGRKGKTGDYAAPQEAGRAGSKVFRNYTTPGTGKHFLKNAGLKVGSRGILYLKQAARLAKV